MYAYRWCPFLYNFISKWYVIDIQIGVLSLHEDFRCYGFIFLTSLMLLFFYLKTLVNEWSQFKLTPYSHISFPYITRFSLTCYQEALVELHQPIYLCDMLIFSLNNLTSWFEVSGEGFWVRKQRAKTLRRLEKFWSEKEALLAHLVAHSGFSSPFVILQPHLSNPLQQFTHVMHA